VVQVSFLAVGISNHSSLSRAYSKFLLPNSQSSDVVDMKRKLVGMEGKVEAVNAKIATFDARIEAVEGASDKVAKGLAAYKTKNT